MCFDERGFVGDTPKMSLFGDDDDGPGSTLFGGTTDKKNGGLFGDDAADPWSKFWQTL